MSTEPTINRNEKQGRVECVVSFSAEQVQSSEETALKQLGKEVKIDGFRPGAAPADMLRQKVDPEQLFNETIRGLLPETMEKLVKDHEIQPIIPPKVEVEKVEPMTLKITFIEQPQVKMKGADKIKVKSEEPEVEEKDIDRMIDYLLKQHQASAPKDGAAAEGDRVTMDFWGETLDGKEVEGIRTTGHQVIIGSKVLLPGFEDELVGLKKGDTKDFTLTFPEKHQVEELRNKPVSFHVTVQDVESVSTPELTDEFVKKNMQLDSVAELKKQIAENMADQEKQAMRRKFEDEALDKIREATVVDLAPELIDDEQQALMQDISRQIEQRGMTFDQWLEQNNQKPDEAAKEMRTQAEKRITVRLGLATLIKERDITITDDEMQTMVTALLEPLSDEERSRVAPSYQQGQQAYEQMRWQKRVERLLDQIIS